MTDPRSLPTELELRLLKSGTFSLETELALYDLIAQDQELTERFHHATPLSFEERRAHVASLLGQGAPPAAAGGLGVTVRRAMREIAEQLRRSLAPPGGGLTLAPGLRSGTQDEEGEVPVLAAQLSFGGDTVDLHVTLRRVRDKDGGELRRSLVVSLVNLDTEAAVGNQRVAIDATMITTAEATTDETGIAEFRFITGGDWLVADPAQLEGDLVVTLLD